MILTGKAKEDFEKWLTKGMSSFAHDMEIEFFNQKSSVEKYALIIEWFDGVGVYIFIKRFITPLGEIEWYFIITNESGCHLNNHVSKESRIKVDSRQIATRHAIIKANEIYNDNLRKTI